MGCQENHAKAMMKCHIKSQQSCRRVANALDSGWQAGAGRAQPHLFDFGAQPLPTLNATMCDQDRAICVD